MSKKNKDNNEDPVEGDNFDDFSGFEEENDGDDIFEADEDFLEPGCPFSKTILAATLCGKPFGMMWDRDIMRDFLKKRGYLIIDRVNPETNESYEVAVLPGDSAMSNLGVSNFGSVFELEIQKILSKWLLSL
jgi:hypothetical protein